MGIDFNVNFFFDHECSDEEVEKFIKIFIEKARRTVLKINSLHIENPRLIDIMQCYKQRDKVKHYLGIEAWFKWPGSKGGYSLGMLFHGSTNELSLSSEWHDHLFSRTEYPDDHWAEDPNANLIFLVEMMKKIYNELKPFHAYMHIEEVVGENNCLAPRHPVSKPKRLNYINFFGPNLAKKLKEERWFDREFYIMEQLDDGGLLIVPAPVGGKEEREYFG